MLAPQVLTAAIEAAANKALKWSSNSTELLVPLVYKVCIIYIQEVKTALLFSFTPQEINVRADIDQLYISIPDDNGPSALQDNECWVSISVFAIDKLKQNNQMTKLIKSGKLDFSGDLAILQALSRLFDKLDIDFEEVLSKYVGDVAAYQFNTSGKKVAAAMASQFTLFTQTLADAALDEKPIGVRPIMLMNFSDEVNIIRADVDRLDAKLAQLEAKLNLNLNPTQGKS
ncbi:MAG: ubiquinone biosynthesis protein UbiJ [Alphaproteobacteria bacterium]|jgi:ubiquinone biosynthesis protein UbiJ